MHRTCAVHGAPSGADRSKGWRFWALSTVFGTHPLHLQSTGPAAAVEFSVEIRRGSTSWFSGSPARALDGIGGIGTKSSSSPVVCLLAACGAAAAAAGSPWSPNKQSSHWPLLDQPCHAHHHRMDQDQHSSPPPTPKHYAPPCDGLEALNLNRARMRN
mmetsp:Transcript_94741/g.159115  ORF Transcript_94741/g.159115 Transcript_94741/m.159115 type:complete len:158 (+) Transcript_94741:570-1043(+)